MIKNDIDQEVKVCSIIAMATIITLCHQELTQDQIKQVVNIFIERL
jgi:hypothetical protein